MRFASVWIGALLGSLLLAGCSADEAGYPEDPVGGSGGGGGAPSVDATLAFEGPSPIDVAPGEVRELTVVASPPAEYEMYFTLLDAPSDTSLDASHLFAEGDGRATVKLHAPGAPASFTVRATIKDGPSAALLVSVSKQGIGTIEVTPVYDGQRPVESWVASVVAGTTCDALAAQLPGEPVGALVAVSPALEKPVIQSVPVGPTLAVAVRAGHYAWGCGDTAGILAGSTTKVKVHVVDVPPALDRTELDLTLAYTPGAPYSTLLESARASFLGAFLQPGVAEPTALLDAMSTLAVDPGVFAVARGVLGWDTLAEAHFAQLPAPLGEHMATWIDAGLSLGPPEITGQLTAIPGVPGKAILTAGTIGGLDAKAAGSPAAHLMSWTSQPGDQVVLSGSLYWMPSRFIGAACRAGAENEVGAPASMGEVIAAAVGCDDLAGALGGSNDCDTVCLADLCRTTVESWWLSALDASAWDGTVGTIEIKASGKLEVDDIATPISLTGMWIGHVSDGTTTAEVEGLVSGALPEPEVPEDPPAGDPPQ